MHLSETPVEPRATPPLHGQHTDAVLRDVLGRSDAEVARLRTKDAI